MIRVKNKMVESRNEVVLEVNLTPVVVMGNRKVSLPEMFDSSTLSYEERKTIGYDDREWRSPYYMKPYIKDDGLKDFEILINECKEKIKELEKSGLVVVNKKELLAAEKKYLGTIIKKRKKKEKAEREEREEAEKIRIAVSEGLVFLPKLMLRAKMNDQLRDEDFDSLECIFEALNKIQI